MTTARTLMIGLAIFVASGARAQTPATNRPDSSRYRHSARDDARDTRRDARRLCVVKKIADGDTFTCADRTKVRLLLIDAPERDQQPFGAAARRQLLRLMTLGDTVSLETDVQPRDRYGRLLAYVYLADGRMVNEEMARAGYVVVPSYPPNVRHIERIRAAAHQAQLKQHGLWSTSAFACTPRDHRRRRC